MSRIAAAMALTQPCETAPAISADTKRLAITALDAAIGASGRARKDLADACGMRESHFNRVARGEQGDVLGLVDRLPEPIREDFRKRFAATKDGDPFDQVMEQVNVAEQMDRVALLWLRLRGVMPQPAKAGMR